MAGVHATWCFHGDLIDLLPPTRRNGCFVHAAGTTDTLKHVIESLGVPHTEIGSVMIDDTKAGLDTTVRGGVRVHVYPVTDAATGEPRFVLDGHLRRLASRLRMLGFDALYGKYLDDEALARLSADEDRILLTRDAGLLKRKEVARGCLVRSAHASQQTQQVVQRFALHERIQPFSRCIECNTPLAPAEREDVSALVPPWVLATRDRFSHCPGCGKVYWQGTHHTHMLRWIDELQTGSSR